MKNNRLKFWNRVKYQIFILFVLTSWLVGCNKNFIKFPPPGFVSNKKIPCILNVPPVYALKDSLLTVQSISSLDRKEENGAGFKLIPFIKVDNIASDSTYKRTIRNLLKLQTEFKISIVNYYKNDSLYKTLMTNTFLQNFSHLDMQRITFNRSIKNGLYLVITNLMRRAEGGIGVGGNLQSAGTVDSNILYEFFYIQNGVPIQYTGFSLGRDYTFSDIQDGPKLKEMRWVLKNLYKQSEKYYGKNKKE